MQQYESDAGALALASVESVPRNAHDDAAYGRARAVLAHIQLARRAWLGRLDGVPHAIADWFPEWTVDRVRFEARDLDRLWRSYFDHLEETVLDGTIDYTASSGVRYRSRVEDVLTHVFNHGTYHRGQIARLVHQLGGTRANTDYIALTRVVLDTPDERAAE